VPLADKRKLFDINFWGVVHGCRTAIRLMKHRGGVLINIGSEVSDAYVPLLGMYVASKHAVKGFTDSLRLEVEQVDKAPVAITLIQPTAVDTPFPQHAKNYQSQEAALPPPMIEPKDVAEAILDAAVTPTRDKRVGGKAVLNTIAAKFAPSVADKMAAKEIGNLHYDERPRDPDGALEKPSEAGLVAGQTHGTGGKRPKE
jgi:short-subunit dehydrogenase